MNPYDDLELLKKEYYNGEKDWAITVEIPAFKKIKFLGDNLKIQNKAYAKYDFKTQKYLLSRFCEYASQHVISVDHVYEQHKDKRWHMHATIYRCTEKTINSLIEWYCTYIVGLPYARQYGQIVYYKPIFKHSGWCDYCVKDMLLNLEEKETRQRIVSLIESVSDEEHLPSEKRFCLYRF